MSNGGTSALNLKKKSEHFSLLFHVRYIQSFLHSRRSGKNGAVRPKLIEDRSELCSIFFNKLALNSYTDEVAPETMQFYPT